MEVRGTVTDRPWGVTLGAIALRHHTGQLTLESDGKRYCIAFDDGVIVNATSPMAADTIARVALTNHFITSTQVSDITRRLAQSADRDEVDVVADAVRFSPEQVLKLRHRLVAQRAARTFSVERGEFLLEDRITLPVFPGIAVDHRHVIYLGVRTNLAEQRLIDDLRLLGSYFVLKPEAIDELPRFGFEPTAHPVLEALKLGTSLPELEASNRDLDPRSAQAIIYSLVSCGMCVIPPRSGTSASREAARPRNETTPPPSAPRVRTTRQPLASPRTSTGSREPPLGPRVGTGPEPVSLPIGTSSGPESLPPTTTEPAKAGTQPPFAAGTATFSNANPASTAQVSPLAAPSTTRSPGSTVSPFGSRANPISPTAYSTAALPDAGTNTPAATRSRTSSDASSLTTPPGPRPATTTAMPRPGPTRTLPAPPAAARSAPATTVPPGDGRTDDAAPRAPARPTSASEPPRRTRTATGPAVSRPAISRTATSDADVVRGFTDQRTPTGFPEQRTPGFGDHRTPTDPSLSRTSTGSPTPPRVSTDNAAAAEAAFKRGELAMKRDQPGEAILEFKTACDLNPHDIDYAAMLAWAKFCAAGDKPAIGAETRKALERAVNKSHRPERARFYLGRVERMLGRDREALRHFQEVLDLKPNHADAASEIRAIEARLQAAAKGTGLFGRKR